MIKNIITLAVFLAPCVAYASQSQIDTAMEQANKAAENCDKAAMYPEVGAAWQKVMQLNDEQCNPKDTPRERAGKVNQCWEKLVRKNVGPVSKNKKALNSYLAGVRKVTAAYKAGDIDYEQVKKGAGGQLWATYASHEMSYFQKAQCENAALQQYVLPVYQNKGMLMDFMARKSEIALKVDQGKISTQEGQVELQKAIAQLASGEQDANSATRAENERAWQNYSQRMQLFSSQLMQAGSAKRQAMPAPSMPVRTNCYKVGNSMDCTSQ
jgi:hypothetical protein